MSFEFLWYIPNQATAGHRGEPVTAGHNSLDTLTAQARALEEHGWKGALREIKRQGDQLLPLLRGRHGTARVAAGSRSCPLK